MNKREGFIGYVLLLIIALALLKYFFNWSIFDAIASQQGQKTLAYLKDILNVIKYYLDILWHEAETFILPIWQKLLSFYNNYTN